MKILKIGSRGPSVELLQLALDRAGYGELVTDGIFGQKTKNALLRFQAGSGLSADGIAGPQTHRAILPWYTGFLSHRIYPGETLWSISRQYGTTVGAIRTANPGTVAENLAVGSVITVPLGFDVVPTDISYTSALVGYCVRGIAARYPFVRTGELGRSVMGKPLRYLALGEGGHRVFYNAAHHANEWICVPLLLKFSEELARARALEGKIFGIAAADIFAASQLFIAPCVDPDGMELVTGELTSGDYYSSARRIAERYPGIPFPSGWKANVRGVDLNLQYPAGWETARENKLALGISGPAPADFVGNAPLSAPEARAMYDFTLSLSPRLVLAYHTQGMVIYSGFNGLEPPGSRELAARLSAASGYASESAPYASGFAGYKDWFVQDFNRPGFTVEAGRGVNPLPLTQFDKIYADNLGILTLAALPV